MHNTLIISCSTLCLLLGAASAIGQAPRNPVQVRQGAPQPKADAPAPCNISTSSLPRFADVFVSMPYDEVATVYPEIEKDKHFHKTFDEDRSGVFIVQAKDLKTPVKDDTVQISLNFKDGAVWIISLVFVEDKWKSVTDAVAESSRLLGVDQKSWKTFHEESAEITCVDFKLGLSSLPGPPRINSLAIHPLQ